MSINYEDFQLAQQVEFYQLLVDSIQDYAIFLLDTSGNIASWNSGAQKLKGYLPHEIIGKHFSVFYTEEDIKKHKPDHVLRKSREEGHAEDEYWRVRKDGSVFWANVVITALRDRNGELVGYAKVTRDLSERKKQEDILKRANEHLREHQAELELLNNAKDEFIAIASHQLRTPATGVKQYLGMLKEGYAGELSDTQQTFVKKAYDSNDRQIDLVNSLLRVAQIDAGKVSLKKASVNVTEMIRDIVEEMGGVFLQREQRAVLQLPDEEAWIDVDPSRFRMVAENLIDNASKYTQPGGTITISAVQTDRECRIGIADTGVGIDKESLVRLFTKFTRIPNSMSDSSTGSGLGLYWVKKMIELHGGEIEVSSEEGVGSTFTIIVPVGEL